MSPREQRTFDALAELISCGALQVFECTFSLDGTERAALFAQGRQQAVIERVDSTIAQALAKEMLSQAAEYGETRVYKGPGLEPTFYHKRKVTVIRPSVLRAFHDRKQSFST